ATGGEGVHTLSSGEMPSHTHTATSNVTDPGHNHANGSFQYLLQSTGGGTTPGPDNTFGEPDVTNKGAILSSTTGISVSTTNANTGGGGAHNNMSPFMLGTWFIRL